LGCHAIFGNEFFHIFFLREALDVGWSWLIDSSIVKTGSRLIYSQRSQQIFDPAKDEERFRAQLTMIVQNQTNFWE